MNPIRTLIVDDSAFARKVVREILATTPQIQVVGAARDGEEALELAGTLAPDVVICDLRMPKVDGVSFVRRQMAVRPLPILILSAAEQDAEEVIEALSAGAVDVVRKPTALATDDLRGVRDELVATLLATANAPLQSLAVPAAMPEVAAVEARRSGVGIVVLGVSTGGPQALRKLLPVLPADFPVPIAMVLHMPVGYTALYAEKLDEICQIDVREAQEGDRLRPGLALLAPAGRHLTIARDGGEPVARLTIHPVEKLHRPSVDVLFQSAAEIYGAGTLGIVMTGMGDDGKEGAAWIKAKGGLVLTEAERTCVIYGMPRSVAEAGLSDAAVPLDEIARAIISRL
jgi:two-component system chemotaxis response regulator CheB